MKQGQRRSPWLLILRLHSCVVFVCACIRHYFPRRQGNHLNRGWLHRVMGVSPPAGSLSAALLAWSPFRWGLGLDGSIIVPDGVIAKQFAIGCFADGWNRSAPYLAVVDRCRSAWLSEPNRNVWVSSFATLRCASTGGLGASSGVARPFSKGPVRKVFRWLGIRFSRNPRGEIIQPPHY